MGFLGMGEADELGNVNVSRLGKRITGSGGFIDISRNAKTMVFCGTFTNGEIILDVKDGLQRRIRGASLGPRWQAPDPAPNGVRRTPVSVAI